MDDISDNKENLPPTSTGSTCGVVLCPQCGTHVNVSPLILSSQNNDQSCTPQKSPSSKRKSSSSSGPSTTKKTRSSGEIKINRKWKEGMPVYVKTHHHGWIEGEIFKVHNFDITSYEVTVHVKDFEGNDVVPRTVNGHNQDPIPSNKIQDCLREKDPIVDDMTEAELQQYICLKHHITAVRKTSEPLELCGELDKLMLDSDSNVHLPDVLKSMISREEVKEVLQLAMKDPSKCSAVHVLAYLLGQFSGIELSNAAKGDKAIKSIIDGLGDSDTIGDQLQNLECDITKVFLVSVMVTRTTRRDRVNPMASLYDPRGRDVLADKKRLEKRLSKLKSCLSVMHMMQFDKPPMDGPALLSLYHGISLILDMKGTSEPVLEKLGEAGFTRSPDVLREYLHKIASGIDPDSVRCAPPKGMAPIVAWTADNADYHLFSRCLSLIPVGNLLLGYESEDDTKHFNENYIKGLKDVADIDVSMLAVTKGEDDCAQFDMDVQSIVHILTVYLDFYKEYLNLGKGPKKSTDHSAQLVENASVEFKYRNEMRQGTLLSFSGKKATIQYTEPNGDTNTCEVPTATVAPVTDAAPTTGSSRDSDGIESEATAGMSKGTCSEPKDNRQRHRFHPTTTVITDVLTNLTSKNHDSARRILESIKSTVGEEEFKKSVHPVTADQEFMPTIVQDYFCKLKSGEPLSILPILACGHAMKGQCTSMISFYDCFFHKIIASLGVREGSSEHRRLCKGKEIRETNRFSATSLESLAVAYAKMYLSSVGSEKRITLDSNLFSPFDLIEKYVLSVGNGMLESSDPTAKSVIALDAQARPQEIWVTKSLFLIAEDFQCWAKSLAGDVQRDEVGPSGYVRKSCDPSDLGEDLDHKARTESIEKDPDFMKYRDMPYLDDGENAGLLRRCIDARLLDSNSRKDADSLAKKLYLLDKEGKNAAIAYSPGPSRKVPHGCNSTALALYDLLFSVERYVIFKGLLLSRVREYDSSCSSQRGRKKADQRCQCCHQYERNCQCSHRYDILVFFKALTVSSFTRRQPNYQRLTLSFLIELTMILNHECKRCADLAFKRIRWSMSLCENGDSWNCQPLDLIQEHSIVQLVKNIGQRDPNATKSLMARVVVKSLVRVKHLERLAGNLEFRSIRPRLQRNREESRVFCTVAAEWLRILHAVTSTPQTPQSSSRGGRDMIIGTGRHFSSRSRAYYRHLDAVHHVEKSARAFLKGYTRGVEVAMPPREYKLLAQLHGLNSVPAAPSPTRSLANEAKRVQNDSRRFLETDKWVMVQQSNSIWGNLDKCGDVKSDIVGVVLCEVSSNEPHQQRDGQIGDGPSRPVVLWRTPAETTRSVLRRAGSAPVHRYVDVAAILYKYIPRRLNGKFKDSLRELSRDILAHIHSAYHAVGVDLVAFVMDTDEFISHLRTIQDNKRGKDRGGDNGSELQYNSSADFCKPDDLLSRIGERSDLLTNGNRKFTRMLFNEICNQLKSADDEANEWFPSKMFRNYTAMVVGGSSEASATVGKGDLRLNSASMTVTRMVLEKKVSCIVKQGEGERMMYAALYRVLRMAFEHESAGEGIDCVVELFSEDSDAFAGMSMGFVHNLETTCLSRRRKFTGALLLHGPKKTVSQVSKLGKIFETSLNIDLDSCPTGRGFEFVVDLISLYYSLEQNDKFAELPRGHRALTVVTVAYVLVNHDYLHMGPEGLKYKNIISVLKSRAYKQDVVRYGATESSPLKIRDYTFVGNNHQDEESGLNLPGVLMLLHHAFINRPKTRKLLLQRYSSSELGVAIPYNVVRAVAALAGELQPVPDPISLLARLSCANFVLRQWTCFVYQENIIPKPQSSDELKGTCYVMTTSKGRRRINVDYALTDIASRRCRNKRTREQLRTLLRDRKYGALFDKKRLETNVTMPFNPLDEVDLALNADGLYPSMKVASNLLPQPINDSAEEQPAPTQSPMPAPMQSPTVPPASNATADDDALSYDEVAAEHLGEEAEVDEDLDSDDECSAEADFPEASEDHDDSTIRMFDN